jgi:WD40 repeat protein
MAQVEDYNFERDKILIFSIFSQPKNPWNKPLKPIDSPSNVIPIWITKDRFFEIPKNDPMGIIPNFKKLKAFEKEAKTGIMDKPRLRFLMINHLHKLRWIIKPYIKPDPFTKGSALYDVLPRVQRGMVSTVAQTPHSIYNKTLKEEVISQLIALQSYTGEADKLIHTLPKESLEVQGKNPLTHYMRVHPSKPLLIYCCIREQYENVGFHTILNESIDFPEALSRRIIPPETVAFSNNPALPYIATGMDNGQVDILEIIEANGSIEIHPKETIPPQGDWENYVVIENLISPNGTLLMTHVIDNESVEKLFIRRLDDTGRSVPPVELRIPNVDTVSHYSKVVFHPTYPILVASYYPQLDEEDLSDEEYYYRLAIWKIELDGRLTPIPTLLYDFNETNPPITTTGGIIQCIEFSPDGKWMVVVGDMNKGQLWKVDMHRNHYRFIKHGDPPSIILNMGSTVVFKDDYLYYINTANPGHFFVKGIPLNGSKTEKSLTFPGLENYTGLYCYKDAIWVLTNPREYSIFIENHTEMPWDILRFIKNEPVIQTNGRMYYQRQVHGSTRSTGSTGSTIQYLGLYDLENLYQFLQEYKLIRVSQTKGGRGKQKMMRRSGPKQ